VGPRQSEIATLAQIKTTHALRQRAFHARPQGLLLFELRRLLTLTCGLYRLMVGLGPHGEGSALRWITQHESLPAPATL
jgi:hypothetical protein